MYKHTTTKGHTYFLNTKSVALRSGTKTNIFYFSKDERPEATDLPAGYIVQESANGLPYVKKESK